MVDLTVRVVFALPAERGHGQWEITSTTVLYERPPEALSLCMHPEPSQDNIAKLTSFLFRAYSQDFLGTQAVSLKKIRVG